MIAAGKSERTVSRGGRTVVYSSDWIVPVSGPLIDDGAVAVKNGIIIAAGPRLEIVEKFPDGIEFRCPTVLLPALFNCHMHLELSWLKKESRLTEKEPGQFTDWISALIKMREQKEPSEKECVDAFSEVLSDQYKSGVAAVLDTGNTFLSELYSGRKKHWPAVCRMLECIAPTGEIEAAVMETVKDYELSFAAIPHAVYSTSPGIIRFLKKRSDAQNHFFSIHTAESKEELEFVRTGRGEFRSFLEQRGRWDGTFDFSRGKFKSVIDYLDSLDVLDNNSLLVHCVHVSAKDIDLIRKNGCRVCLCPGSNRFLGVGRAPVVEMSRAGITLCLGTDSPASNATLDIWEEMRLLHDMYDELGPADILFMATKGGAEVLGMADRFGFIQPGCSAELLQVSSGKLRQCRDGYEVVKELVSGGRPADISWINMKS
jgi:cytosine/adenosine deaminase-related metal-dependent hydrolase